MKISLNWLRELVTIPDNITPEEIGENLTLKTVEVEGIEKQGDGLEGVVVGKILEIKKHPNADKLRLCSVDIGEKDNAQIVCGGTNLKEGMLTAVAKVGAKVRWHGKGDWTELEKAKIRGVESNGMICASSELGIGDILPQSGESEIIDLNKRGSGADSDADEMRIVPGMLLADVLGLNDVIFDIDNKSLTNRPDLWGHVGIAREIHSIFGVEMQTELTNANGISQIFSTRRNLRDDRLVAIRNDRLTVNVENQELCPRYMAVAMSGIKIGPSPHWMQNKLLAVGMRPINNIVDVTNYVMLELGQPTHAFNQLSVISYQLSVRNARDDEKITTLDGVERKLDSDMLVIADSEKAIAVAGVMGGANSEIDNKTTDIILESANFEKVNNRQTGAKLGLRTEAVMRYEKGLDPNLTEQALARCVELIQQIIPEAKVSSDVVDIKKKVDSVDVIGVSTEYINKKIGADISEKRIMEILESLGFGIKKQNAVLQVSVPSWRATGDINIKEDIVEEVARIYGFDNIVPQSPKVAIEVPEKNKERELTYKIKNVLKWRGMTETSNYSFVNGENLKRMGFNIDSCVEISNPISNDSKFLRPSLILGLLQNAKDNLRFEKEFSMFEVGSVFRKIDGKDCADSKCEEKLPWQEKFIAGMIVMDKSEVPFYKAKEVAEGLLKELDINYDFSELIGDIEEWEHPHRIMNYELRIKNTTAMTDGADNTKHDIGYVTEVNPVIVKKIGIKNARVAVFEFPLEELAGAVNQNKQYKKISKFPSVLRDLAVIVNKRILVRDIIQFIKTEAGKGLADIELFDYYENKRLGENKKSLAFHLIFQSMERTLDDKEIDEILNRIINKLEKKFKAELRK